MTTSYIIIEFDKNRNEVSRHVNIVPDRESVYWPDEALASIEPHEDGYIAVLYAVKNGELRPIESRYK